MSEDQNVVPVEDVEEFYALTNKVVRSVVAVIDTIVQRGGFRGEELSTIGQLRDQCIQAVQMCESFDASREDSE